MALNDTLKRLEQQKKAADDWEQNKPKVLSDWQTSVKQLLCYIEDILSPYAESGALVLKKKSVVLSEEYLGSYQIDALQIEAGLVTLQVIPVGMMIIGAQGRVDLKREGRPNSVLFLRTNDLAAGKSSWNIRISEAPRTLVDFNKENLEAALDGLLE